jgi:hypothetical protein
MVGMGRLSSLPSAVRKSVRNLDTWPLDIVRRSAKSAPEQNEPGVEEFRMSTRTESSKRTVSKQSVNCWVHMSCIVSRVLLSRGAGNDARAP